MLTDKQERFCQLVVELGNNSDAYRGSYSAEKMKPETINNKAYQLLQQGDIRARVDQLRGEAKKAHGITVESLLKELEEARACALTAETVQSSAAVTATMSKAKLLGLDKQIIDHTSSDGSMTPKATEFAVLEALRAKHAK